MCRPTDRITLCSCETDPDLSGNHWMLNRFRKGKNEIVIGETLVPDYPDPEIRRRNVRFLTDQINQGNCFDFEVEFQEKDQLVLSFTDEEAYQDEVLYVFEFRTGEWKSIDTDKLSIRWYHDTIRKGSILKA